MIAIHSPSGALCARSVDDLRLRGVVVFGLEQLAELAWYCLTHDSEIDVVAFTVDRAYLSTPSLQGLPVVALESLAELFPPEHYAIHLPIGWKGMNALRTRKLAQVREMGYSTLAYVSSKAIVWPDLNVGANCEIHQSCSINPFVRIGDNNLIYSSGGIGHHAVVEDNCFIAGGVAINGGAIIGSNSFIGSRSTIIDEVRIAPGTFIAAGSVVTQDTVENGVYSGIPARRREHLKADGLRLVS